MDRVKVIKGIWTSELWRLSVPVIAVLLLISCREQPGYEVDVVRSGLDLPASLEFLPDGRLLILDRGFVRDGIPVSPAVLVLDLKAGRIEVLKGDVLATPHENPVTGNQGGAVGMALDPESASNPRIYICYHHDNEDGVHINRLSRFEIDGNRLKREKVLVDQIPGDPVHNGCRVVVDDKGFIFLTTGSMEPFGDALDPSVLSGKILRVNRDGTVPVDNPFPGSLVWSYGHRNPQGLAFDPKTGVLWSTEHGESSDDELNRIEKNANYGWPACRGWAKIGDSFAIEEYFEDRFPIKDGKTTCQLPEAMAAGYRAAIRSYYPEPNSTVGISDLVVYDGLAFPEWRGSLLIVTLKSQQLFRVQVEHDKVVAEETLIDGSYGRLRDITVGPDGFVYLLTNEMSGRTGNWGGGSRLLRLRPRY